MDLSLKCKIDFILKKVFIKFDATFINNTKNINEYNFEFCRYYSNLRRYKNIYNFINSKIGF